MKSVELPSAKRVPALGLLWLHRPARMGPLFDDTVQHQRLARAACAIATAIGKDHILAQGRRKNGFAGLHLKLFATGLNADFKAHGL